MRILCRKFPAKRVAVMAFLSDALRDEGGYEYKKVIVDSLVDLMEHVPESKEHGRPPSHLC